MCPEARLAYVTPSHQFPLGMTMSQARRRELLQWAQQTGSWIVEDDYDSEYRFFLSLTKANKIRINPLNSCTKISVESLLRCTFIEDHDLLPHLYLAIAKIASALVHMQHRTSRAHQGFDQTKTAWNRAFAK